ncbi:hypothetical protein B0H65DRAFT_143828 [Neurospora tetraspora]|uniref:Uncharacterized protein n=1 Tax=Neurospora tetraspora TaxID=94610 RepID=A0AAE0JMP6_9PEZI|nr:hypothetical protein B0H65DRAFT_143828 [Neurospora tetraspora]
MPTINLPAGSSTQLEPRPAHQHHLRSFAVDAYLGIAVTLVIVSIWCFKPRRRSSTPSSASYGSQPDVKEIKASLCCAKLVRPELTEGSYPKESSQYLVLATPSSVNELSHPLSSAYTKVPRASEHLQAMDGHDKGQLSDRSDPEATASLAVNKKAKSTSSSKYEACLWPQASSSVSMTGSSTPDRLRKHMPPPKTSTSTEGTTSSGSTSREEGRGKEHLQTQHRQIDGIGTSTAESLSYDGVQRQDDGLHGVSVGEPRLHFTRPPPPPPLTPPTLDKTAFAFQDRRPTYAASVPRGLDVSFIHQPNPDYIGHTSSVDILSSSPAEATGIPRRRSYTKSVPVGIPIPTSSFSSSTATTVTSSSAFSPSSYPSSSPLFPPPPPVPQDYQFVGGHVGHRASVGNQHQDEIEVHGEIISVTDDDGHGWQRHTQVYGGGVCLACLANGGGFYGPNVPLEDRRY